jgi:hypothetical protein
MDKITKMICVGHKIPDFSPPVDYLMLCPESIGFKNEFVISDRRFGVDYDAASMAEYSQLFGLADLIKSGDFFADYLYLFQYRKFISPMEGGYDSVASWTKVLSPKMAVDMFPGDDFLSNIKDQLIIGGLLDFGENISENYSRVHKIEDFVNFSAACAQSGAVSIDSLKLLSGMHGILPSPAICFVSVELFLNFMDILKNVGDIFMRNFHKKREGYQMRSAGYLLERLHSVIICQKIIQGEIVNPLLWNRYVINSEI